MEQGNKKTVERGLGTRLAAEVEKKTERDRESREPKTQHPDARSCAPRHWRCEMSTDF
ncbi:hypothetical protein TorRG33x02_029570, partial [Trema orientale]